jgi:hypothetical protein
MPAPMIVMYTRVTEARDGDDKPYLVMEGPFYAATAKNETHLKEVLKTVNADHRGGMILIKTYQNITIGEAYDLAWKTFRKKYEDMSDARQTFLRKRK